MFHRRNVRLLQICFWSLRSSIPELHFLEYQLWENMCHASHAHIFELCNTLADGSGISSVFS